MANIYFSLQYDSDKNRYSNADGVKIRVPGFGGTDNVEYLDTFNVIFYLRGFVEYFVERGYVRGNTIRTAPYDWRFAAG